MASALSKQVRDRVVAFGEAVGDFAPEVVAFRDFATANAAAVTAWPVANGYLVGYHVTKTELGQIKALADALAALGTEHAAALATLRRLR